jgi:hypothetical protein
MKYIGFPRPSYPLGGMLEPVGFGPCKFESNIQEKETASEVVQRSRRIISEAVSADKRRFLHFMVIAD